MLIFANFLSSFSMGVVLILIPWLIVDKIEAQALIVISILANLAIAIFRKKIGYLVDSMPRGKLLSLSMGLIAVVLVLQSLAMNNMYALLATFFCGQVYLFFYYVTRSSLTHEIVSPEEYSKYNGILEIENQVSTFSAGGLTAFLLGQNFVSEAMVLTGAAIGLTMSSLIVVMKVKNQVPNIAPLAAGEGNIAFPRTLVILALCSSIPFICVMLLNVIKPIVIDNYFESAVDILALTSVFYAVGAIVSGLLSNTLFQLGLNRQVIYFTLAGFSLFCLIPAFYMSAPVLYISSFFWGLFNGTSRIVWQSMVMNQLSNDVIGRFFTKVTITIDLLKIHLLGLYWVLFTFWEQSISFPYLTVICLIGLGAFVLSHRLSLTNISKEKPD